MFTQKSGLDAIGSAGIVERCDGNFFEHIGLPRDVSWELFRALYAVSEDDVDWPD